MGKGPEFSLDVALSLSGSLLHRLWLSGLLTLALATEGRLNSGLKEGRRIISGGAGCWRAVEFQTRRRHCSRQETARRPAFNASRKRC